MLKLAFASMIIFCTHLYSKIVDNISSLKTANFHFEADFYFEITKWYQIHYFVKKAAIFSWASLLYVGKLTHILRQGVKKSLLKPFKPKT